MYIEVEVWELIIFVEEWPVERRDEDCCGVGGMRYTPAYVQGFVKGLA